MQELAQQVGRVFGPEFHSGYRFIEPLASLLFVALLIAGAIIVVRMITDRQRQSGASRGPVQILEERFAKGEIDEDEFRTRREALRS